MKEKELQDFIDKNCKDCKAPCAFGIKDMPTFIRCVDRNIYKRKEIIDFKEEDNV